MRKCTLFIFIILSLLFISLSSCKKINKHNGSYTLSNYFNSWEIDYIKKNEIKESDLLPYTKFSSFNVFKFQEYESIRKKNSLSYIQALNKINYPNYYEKYLYVKPAVFIDYFYALVNKEFYLDSSYIPNNMISLNETKINYIKRENETMKANKTVLENYYLLECEAKKNNFNLFIFSAYRSFDKQQHIYYDINNCNDETVARPGFSEHQLGYSLDVSTLEYGLTNYFEESNEYKWLISNAHKYGFILRYPKGKEYYTGYNFEPWHFRYVGESLATFIYKNNLTLEEYIYNYLEIK